MITAFVVYVLSLLVRGKRNMPPVGMATTKTKRNERLLDIGIGMGRGTIFLNKLMELMTHVNDGNPGMLGEALVVLKEGLNSEEVALADVMRGNGSNLLPVLILGLKSDQVPIQLNACWIISKILVKGNLAQREKVVVEEEIYKSLQGMLSSSYETIWQHAIVTLGILIKSGPKARDEVIRHGGIDKLITLLGEKAQDGVAATLPIMGCFEDILATKPRVGLDIYEKLVDSLKWFIRPAVLAWYERKLGDKDAYHGKEFLSLLRCVGHLAAYGIDGLKLLEKKGFLENIIEMLQFKHQNAQRMALLMLKEICRAERNYVPILIRKGIFDHYEPLRLHWGLDIELSYAVFTLYLLDGLTPAQRNRFNPGDWIRTLPGIFKALKGSRDPRARFKSKVDQILKRRSRARFKFS